MYSEDTGRASEVTTTAAPHLSTTFTNGGRRSITDNTRLHRTAESRAHQIDLHLWRGAPENRDPDRPIEVLINDGFVVGFSPTRLQPAWVGYRVADGENEQRFTRPPMYHEDVRLDEAHRIGRGTFGRLGETQLNVGHMAPNAVITRQYGRLGQLETFLMSNMSPQWGSLNQGVWADLEDAIRNINDDPDRDNVWVLVGPVFGDQPATIDRGPGKHLAVPEAYFCIAVDPHRYPYNTFSRVNIDCFLIPQDAPRTTDPLDYLSDLQTIENATGLEFFTEWGRDLDDPIAVLATEAHGERDPERPSRLLVAMEERRQLRADELETALERVDRFESEIDHPIVDLINELLDEAAQIQKQGRALTEAELQRLEEIQDIIAWLLRALELLGERDEEPIEEPESPRLVTYFIEELAEHQGRLTRGARTACNFWNTYLTPKRATVIRLGTFNAPGSNTIARAWPPTVDEDTDTAHGRVQFNLEYLSQFTDGQIAVTTIHEIGHTLGIGFGEWDELFNPLTGLFYDDAKARLDLLDVMEVERDGGPGTRLSHWDEDRFGSELMTGYQELDTLGHVLPVTIQIMKLLDHDLIEPVFTDPLPLRDVSETYAGLVFSRQDRAERISRDYVDDEIAPYDIPHT